MRVTVSAFGDLRRHLLGGQLQRALELPEGAVLADIARALDADPDELPLARRGDSVLREGERLCEGDHVELFAPVGGG